jgi:hypothetical protein
MELRKLLGVSAGVWFAFLRKYFEKAQVRGR